MSKTDPSGAILLDDPIEISLNKIKRAQSAFAGEKSETLDTLVLIGEFVGNEKEVEQIKAIMKRHYDGENVMGELKSVIMIALKRYLENFQERKAALDEKQIIEKIKRDGIIAKRNAQETLLEIRNALGLRYI
jgi:tryptophanyl-tRNA synthetase